MVAQITEGRGRPSASFRSPYNTPLRKRLNGRGAVPRKPDEMETRLSGQHTGRGSRRHRRKGACHPRLSFGPDSAPMERSHWWNLLSVFLKYQ